MNALRRLATALAAVLVLLASSVSAQPATSPACAAPEYRKLDFWAGDWDAYEVGGGSKPVARAHVDVILGGCVVREIFEQNDGMTGQSFTIYDASRRVWHQTWVTNRGRLLMIEGRFDGKSLTLSGPERLIDGTTKTLRGVWTPQGDGVREIAHSSTDGGASWQPWFDILFRPHDRQGAPPR
jgi:hypothetical protein